MFSARVRYWSSNKLMVIPFRVNKGGVEGDFIGNKAGFEGGLSSRDVFSSSLPSEKGGVLKGAGE